MEQVLIINPDIEESAVRILENGLKRGSEGGFKPFPLPIDAGDLSESAVKKEMGREFREQIKLFQEIRA